MRSTVALFGEAEKGAFQTPGFCRSVNELLEIFGNPPKHSAGIFFAIQALMYNHVLLFFRVHEEGFSYDDYIQGLNLLKSKETDITALCLPGVGDKDILQAFNHISFIHHSILITNESDLYDYLMH